MGILTNGPSAVDGAIGEIITEREGITLHGLLKLLRSEKYPAWLHGLLGRLAIYADLGKQPDRPSIEIKDMLGILLNSVNETDMDKDVDAIMYQRDGGTFTILGSYEHEQLLRYLGVERSESWLGGFIDAECRVFEAHKNRTPEQTIRALVGEEMAEFDCNVETTQKMLKLHPDLFTSDIERLAPKPAEKPQAEPNESEPETPQYHQLTEVKDGDVKDAANLTRSEFRELKKHLAALRARKPRRRKAAA